MKKENKKKGICNTCNNDPHCTFPRNNGTVPIQCDEFEPQERAPKKNARQRIRAVPVWCDGFRTGQPLSSKGLCSNCENFESCCYPKPEGGVWHCEEYQ